MNTCQRIDSLVSAFLEHEASPAEVRFVEGHLPTCPRCRAQIHEVSLAMEELSRLPRVQTRPEFTDEVLVRTRGLRAADLESREPWALAPRFTTRRLLQWQWLRKVMSSVTRRTATASTSAPSSRRHLSSAIASTAQGSPLPGSGWPGTPDLKSGSTS